MGCGPTVALPKKELSAGDFSENADNDVEDYKLMEALVLRTHFDEKAPRLTLIR